MADRDESGKFLPGHKVTGNPGNALAGVQQKLRHYFCNLAKTEDLDKIYNSILEMAQDCPDYKTRLAACDLFLTRLIGKVKDEVQVEVTNVNPINSVPDAMARLRSLLNKETTVYQVPKFTEVEITEFNC